MRFWNGSTNGLPFTARQLVEDGHSRVTTSLSNSGPIEAPCAVVKVPGVAFEPREDVSPSRSGHDGLTPGLGDRTVAMRTDALTHAAIAEEQEACSSDAPLNNNPDSPCPPAMVEFPRNNKNLASPKRPRPRPD